MGYFRRLLISLDQLFNVLVLNGFPDETASSHWGREKKHKDRAAVIACDVLDVLDVTAGDHCSSSIEETTSGETDAHHLGRVIRELPRDPATRLHKVPVGVLVTALALFLAGCASVPKCDPPCAPGQLCGSYRECPGVFGFGGCTTHDVCRGTPNDCRTNGCPGGPSPAPWLASDYECRPQSHENDYACVRKACFEAFGPVCDEVGRDTSCWNCVSWQTGNDCCYVWRYEEPVLSRSTYAARRKLR